ncbi:hypothetical protein SAY87_024684 [Trapa incisa]|uniref:Uncharacterized protein n=1 Tax=Trapa incisa TaxID=236973 RepID=A0AAN7J8V2_9MYRT|nr:hypothetical protein SAY87_024684 [Trapa incisa]
MGSGPRSRPSWQPLRSVVAPQARQGVASLDLLDDLDVVRISGAVELGGDPLVGEVEGSRLEDSVDFCLDLLKAGGGL